MVNQNVADETDDEYERNITPRQLHPRKHKDQSADYKV